MNFERHINAVKAARLKSCKLKNNKQNTNIGYIVAFKKGVNVYGASAYRDDNLKYRNFDCGFGYIVDLEIAIDMLNDNKDKNVFVMKSSRIYDDIEISLSHYDTVRNLKLKNCEE